MGKNNNRIGKLCLAAAVALLLTFSSCFCAFAAVPDLQRKCTASFSMNYNGSPLEGGNLNMFRIASWTESNGAYSFAWTPELADCGMDLGDYASETFARRIFMLVESRSLPAKTVSIGAGGVAAFKDLDSGLYVVYQTQAPDGFEPINAFCMSLPMEIDGGFVYYVQATPKPRPEKPPHTTPDVTTPDVTKPDVTKPDVTTPGVTTPSVTTPSVTTPGVTTPGQTPPNDVTAPSTTAAQFIPPAKQQQERLPQTGQLWWPAWLIGAVGAILCGLGLVLRVLYRDDAEESEA